MAIIYRSNAEAVRIGEVCAHYQVPVAIEGGADVLAQPLLQRWMDLLRLVGQLEQPTKTTAALAYRVLWQPWWQLDQVRLLELQRVCLETGIPIIKAILSEEEKIWSVDAGNGLKTADYESFFDFGRKLLIWVQNRYTKPLTELVSQMMGESGLLEYIRAQPDYTALLTYFYTWQTAVAGWQRREDCFDLEKLLETWETMREQGIKMPAQSLSGGTDALCLTTAHKAKGREWTHVFVYGLNDGMWSNRRVWAKVPLPQGIVHQELPANDTAEQLRLLYVALTRAKQCNFVSWHLQLTDGLTTTPKVAAAWVPLLADTREAGWVKVGESTANEVKTATQLMTLLSPALVINLGAATREFLTRRVKELTLSVSMLNTYLTDTTAFVERYLLQTPPEPATAVVALGNSLHYALQQVGRQLLTERVLPPIKMAQEWFGQDFGRQRVSEPEFSAYRQLGMDSLLAYYPKLEQVKLVAVERNFGRQPKLVCGQVPVTGKIDRIDLLDDGSDGVRVVDYKSGSPMSLNQILGQTASVRLSERERSLPAPLQTAQLRQLLFYKLLVELEPQFPYQAKVGTLEFIKATAEKRPMTRPINLLDEHVEMLKDLIQEVWAEIQSLSFVNFDAVDGAKH
jgi:ATP-dependent exoDNAse (exonuclease V) beta subunit